MTYFRDEGHFDSLPWTVYFHLGVAFLGQSLLQLEKYSNCKRQRILDQYGDMRHQMAFQILSLWSHLGSLRLHFIPGKLVTVVGRHNFYFRLLQLGIKTEISRVVIRISGYSWTNRYKTLVPETLFTSHLCSSTAFHANWSGSVNNLNASRGVNRNAFALRRKV